MSESSSESARCHRASLSLFLSSFRTLVPSVPQSKAMHDINVCHCLCCVFFVLFLDYTLRPHGNFTLLTVDLSGRSAHANRHGGEEGTHAARRCSDSVHSTTPLHAPPHVPSRPLACLPVAPCPLELISVLSSFTILSYSIILLPAPPITPSRNLGATEYCTIPYSTVTSGWQCLVLLLAPG